MGIKLEKQHLHSQRRRTSGGKEETSMKCTIGMGRILSPRLSWRPLSFQ